MSPLTIAGDRVDDRGVLYHHGQCAGSISPAGLKPRVAHALARAVVNSSPSARNLFHSASSEVSPQRTIRRASARDIGVRGSRHLLPRSGSLVAAFLGEPQGRAASLRRMDGTFGQPAEAADHAGAAHAHESRAMIIPRARMRMPVPDGRSIRMLRWRRGQN